ncbi:hypothetical protein [Chitinilyticum aquatile]|uniref:hypothetical protein n=1 Tax=Chitinilyticum aquatile TaxID=362520 RepID=UPI0004078805|nr:hypothetical protein [Chitinilyticum aquatile]
MSDHRPDERRFDLGVIDEQKKKLADAKVAARDREANRSASRLQALTNLPLLIVIAVWLIWYFSR